LYIKDNSSILGLPHFSNKQLLGAFFPPFLFPQFNCTSFFVQFFLAMRFFIKINFCLREFCNFFGLKVLIFVVLTYDDVVLFELKI
jgi:hypothetical protein